MDDVHYVLSSACTKSNIKEVQADLARLEDLLISVEKPIDATIIKYTRKLFTLFGYSLYKEIPYLYIKYLKLIDKSNTELLISLCNDALLVKDSLAGTEIAENINSSVREALIHLVQQGSLDSQQSSVVQQLLETKQSLNFEEEFNYVIEELDNDSSVSIHILIDLFSTISTVKEQFNYYSTQISPMVKSLQTKKSVEIYSLVIKFIDIFLLPTRFLIKIESAVVEYQLNQLKLFAIYEDTFYTSLSLIKILVKADRYISENSIKIIYKLWNLYPALRSHLYEVILANLKMINTSNSLEPKKRAAEFLYLIMHDKAVDGDFKGKLESECLDSLFNNESYEVTELQPMDLKTLKINSGFPICCEINPGEKHTHYIEISEENSILAWGFATEEYDISYKISRMGTVEEVLFQEEKSKCEEVPIMGVELVQKPGLYKFEWNNSFSWFRSKRIRFRISVLVPISKKPEAEDSKIISILNPDEIGDLCYVLPSTSFVEIGVSIKSDSISFFSSESDTFPLKPSDDIPSIIARYCEIVKGPNKKIGVVEKDTAQRNYSFDFGCIAACRDIDAFALLNHDSLQVHTLIAVVEQDGLRSAVVIDGKLFSGGNIANLKNQEPAAAISALLSLFGPGVVVVLGIDLEKIIGKVRLLVPVGIWNHSQMVVSDYSLAECASKLHYLHHRYRCSL